MPKLSPLPTQIKDKHPYLRFYTWITFRRRWEVLEDWKLQLPHGQPCIVIPQGFLFDGVSVPKPLHWFLSPTGVLFIPGLVHDFAYRYGYLWACDEEGNVYKYQEGSSRYFWDSTFKALGLELNEMYVLNTFSHLILFTFGWISWKENRKKPFHELKPIQS